MEIKRVGAEPGYVLHSRPYRESSFLLDIFSQHYGKVRLVARGVRQKNTKKPFLLQPFLQGCFSWTGRGPLYQLITVEDYSNGYYLFSSLQLCSGLYVNELLIKLLAYEDACPLLYQAYHDVLKHLSENTHPTHHGLILEIILRLFERKLLQQLGYGLCLETIEKKSHYLFDRDQGLRALIYPTSETISGESLIAFKNEDWQPQHLAAIKKLMRRMIAYLLDGKSLKTRELFL